MNGECSLQYFSIIVILNSVTAVRCCKLAIFLTRSMTKEATEALNVGKKSRKLLLSEEESGMAEEENATQEQSNERQKEKNKLSSQEIMRQQLLLQNAKDQLAAFLSFKDAFCTGKSQNPSLMVS